MLAETVIVKNDGATGSTTRYGLLQFDLSSLVGSTVNSATLSLYGYTTNTTPDTVAAYSATNNWTQLGVTWDTMGDGDPSISTSSNPPTATIGTTPQYYDWTVSSLLPSNVSTSNDTVSIALEMTDTPSNGEGDSFYSTNNSSSDKPQLVVQYNAPPTVAQPAAASANPVTGTTTNLSVLGADDGGQSNLTYTWSAAGPATVSYSSNGTNASQNTTATFTQAGTYSFTVTITDAGGLSTTSGVSVTVNQTATSLSVSAPASATAGGQFQVSVTGLDQFGNSDSSYNSTVAFTSTDPTAVLPSSAPVSNGPFNATLETAGSQTITATDTSNSSITGTSSSITVSAASASNFTLVPAATTSNPAVPVNVTVTAYDQYGNTATGYSGTVTFSSSDSSAQLPANSTLSSGIGTFPVTFNTVADDTVTATDTVTNSITGTCSVNIISQEIAAFTAYPSIVVGSSSNTSTGTVTLNVAAPSGGTTVSLSSNNTSDASVPATVTIAQGATSGTFSITTASVTSPQPAVITASLASTTVTSSLTVVPTLASVGFTPACVVGGNSRTAVVTLYAPAPSGGATISLTSCDPSVASVPSQAVVPAGATTVTFAVTTSSVTTTSPVSISASYGGATVGGTITVVPAVTAITLSPASASVQPGGSIDFSATDQFGDPISASVLSWGVVSGSGSVSRGDYTAPSSSGTASVQAEIGSLAQTAAITISSVPVNLTVTAGNEDAFLTWAPVSGATGYNVYRSTTSGSGYTELTSGSPTVGNAYFDSGLTNGTTYYYVVTALDPTESDYSSQSSATPATENGSWTVVYSGSTNNNITPANPSYGAAVGIAQNGVVGAAASATGEFSINNALTTSASTAGQWTVTWSPNAPGDLPSLLVFLSHSTMRASNAVVANASGTAQVIDGNGLVLASVTYPNSLSSTVNSVAPAANWLTADPTQVTSTIASTTSAQQAVTSGWSDIESTQTIMTTYYTAAFFENTGTLSFTVPSTSLTIQPSITGLSTSSTGQIQAMSTSTDIVSAQ